MRRSQEDVDATLLATKNKQADLRQEAAKEAHDLQKQQLKTGKAET